MAKSAPRFTGALKVGQTVKVVDNLTEQVVDQTKIARVSGVGIATLDDGDRFRKFPFGWHGIDRTNKDRRIEPA